MKRTKHTGQTLASCPACITQAEIERMPWQSDYLAVLARSETDFRKRHNTALRRAKRNDAMRSCGLVKVKGALGGTYWE